MRERPAPTGDPTTLGSSSLDSVGTSPATIADRVAQRLERFLGPHTARVAVKTFSLKGLGRGPETLVASDVPTLVATLKPMLRTLIGEERGETIARQILEEFGQ